MEGKIADNEIISQNKSKIDSIEENIYSNKKMINNIDETKDKFIDLNKEFQKCYDLLRKSMKSKSLDNKIQNYTEANNHNLNKTLSYFDEKKDLLNNNIKDLYKQKDDLEQEIKDKYKEMDKKEE